ncbi:hypothetical protein E5K00_18155 [Hymenobacter aquaticus]|uniref:Uncharacterized protein n=1 Tax=Hymenobacter aquaticus TaxID=1867101 RepID=A0A4Z0PZ47_9BACT|nr:hypothetical protein [Hymenobacter aquaticus]TGE22171.1 hypothetical protein E5K00_18155 [Hymenobacter aquaticus]
MIRTLLSFCWLLLWSGLHPGAGWAQALPAPPPDAPAQTARVELDLQSSSSEVQVLAIPEDSSIVLLIEKEPTFAGNSTFTFHKLDQQLQTRWTKPLEVPDRYYLSQICNEGTMVYALFHDDFLSNKLWVAALNSRTGEVRTTSYDTKLVHEAISMKALEGNLFVTVQIEQHLTVLLLNLRSGEFTFLPAVYEPAESQLTFLADSLANQVKFVVSQTNGLKSRLQVKQISPQGQLLHSEFVQAESNRSLLTAQLSPGDSSRLMMGTYTLRDNRYSQGLFATNLTLGLTPTGARPPLRFYDFLHLKHFFDFMSPNRQARLRQRGAKRQAAAREFRLHYRLLMHDLIPSPEGYVLVAEVYYPQYRYNGYGFGVMGSMRNFDGYRTTHAIVCGFDHSGTLLWDNTFVLKNTERYRLEETVRLRPLPDNRRYALTYLDEHRIHYKIIDRTAASPNDLQVPLLTTLKPGVKEKSTSTSHTDMQAWYGSRFLAFGYQHVRGSGWNGRDVFFINTVDFN